MSCFPCFRKSKKSADTTEADERHYGRQRSLDISAPYHVRSAPLEAPISARTFTFRELAAATKNFRQDNFIGQGGFGSVYKGRLENGQVVAIKQLDKNGTQGNKEFLVEVLMLSLLKHPNLVNLIGYCADGDQRLLVYEYMPLGSVEDRLYDAAVSPDKEPLDWKTRIIIAEGAAKGLEYLHDEAKPPVIYRDLKTANILLDEGFHPKLSDFGLAKLGPVGDQSHVSTRVMGTYGYCAPEYALTGQLTKKSDIYSFGVVLLELITGKPALDETKPHAQQSLVSWARPYLSDRNKMVHLADPLLRGRCQMRSLYQALAVAAVCLHDVPEHRPRISDIVMALSSIRNSIPAASTPASVSRPLAAASLRRNISENDVQNEGKNQIAYYEENPAKDNARATS